MNFNQVLRSSVNIGKIKSIVLKEMEDAEIPLNNVIKNIDSITAHEDCIRVKYNKNINRCIRLSSISSIEIQD